MVWGESVSGRLSTGVEALDRRLDGGLFPGSLVAVCAPPDSQSEPLLQATMRERPTRYVTTRRNERVVDEALSRAFAGESVDYVVTAAGPAAPDRTVRDALGLPGPGGAVVVDPVDPIERAAGSDEYAALLNDLKSALVEAGGLAFLHCAAPDDRVERRDITESFADVVWDVHVERDGTRLKHVLEVPKFRGGDLPEETITIKPGRRVTVDHSRDIA